MNPNIPTQPSAAHIFQPEHPNHRKIIIGFVIAVIVVVGLIAMLYLVKQQQELRQRAAGPVCPVDGASCSWDATSGATSYHYKIVNIDNGTTVKEGDTTNTSVNFTSIPGTTFSCVVTASNTCGTGPQGEGTATCPVLSSTPTPTETPTPSTTPTPTTINTPTPTPVACLSTCSTDSDCSSATGSNGTTLTCINGMCRNPECSTDNTCFCGSPTPTETVTPTETLTPTNTVTPTYTETPTETPSVTPSDTQTPTPAYTATVTQTETPTPTSPTQAPGNTATPTNQPTVIVYNTTATPTTFLSPSVSLPVTGPGDKFLNIGLVAVEVTLVGALIFFAL